MHSVALLAAFLACISSSNLRCCHGQPLPSYATQLTTTYNKRYVFVNYNQNWARANDWCKQYSMTLAQFSTLAEGEAVHAAVKAVREPSGCNEAMTEPNIGIFCWFHQYWIGAFNPTETKGAPWAWVDGSSILSSAANWIPGQPDSYVWQDRGFEACGTVAFQKDVAMWNDVPCEYELNFLCSGISATFNVHIASDVQPCRE